MVDKLKNIHRQLSTSARMRTGICEKSTPKTLKKTPNVTSLLSEEDLEECEAVCRNTMDKRKVMDEKKLSAVDPREETLHQTDLRTIPTI